MAHNTDRQPVQSFEVTRGGASGDLLSSRRGDRNLVVGLLACAYFEYWRMYESLREQVEGDMRRIAERLAGRHQLVYPGLVDTLDGADAAGRLFREKHVDLLVITEGTYCPDYVAHQVLVHLPADIPLCIFASQAHGELDFAVGYDQALRNSGPMGLVQLTAGFRKMGQFPQYEVVTGTVDDETAYKAIDRFIRVRTTISNLRHWNIGLVGHVFRGMYDFQYDKTSVTGKLGPQIIDIDVRHLAAILDEIAGDDQRVTALYEKSRDAYTVVGLTKEQILRASRLGVALQELLSRYKLNGLALLGQHLIEARANASCYLGLAEILSSDRGLAVTEGDVLGLIVTKVLKDLTGHTAFFGEWEEIDTSRNAVMLLGHGFIDPREARKDRPVLLQPACENWGFEGESPGIQATYEPGPVTMAHVIEDPKGWRMLICEGQIMDVPPLNISESSLVVHLESEVKRFFRELLKLGFPHHAIAGPGHVASDLECFAGQLDIEICRL